jgi:hypothetical protein
MVYIRNETHLAFYSNQDCALELILKLISHYLSTFAKEHIPDILTRGNLAQGKVICSDGCGTFCYQF